MVPGIADRFLGDMEVASDRPDDVSGRAVRIYVRANDGPERLHAIEPYPD